jgi:hypothetical protein
MNTSEVTLEVLNPRGKIPEDIGISVLGRLSDLSGRKIGVLNNTKIDGDTLLPYLEESLRRRISAIQLLTWKVPYGLSLELKEPRLREIVEYSDGVIALLGD